MRNFVSLCFLKVEVKTRAGGNGTRAYAENHVRAFVLFVGSEFDVNAVVAVVAPAADFFAAGSARVVTIKACVGVARNAARFAIFRFDFHGSANAFAVRKFVSQVFSGVGSGFNVFFESDVAFRGYALDEEVVEVYFRVAHRFDNVSRFAFGNRHFVGFNRSPGVPSFRNGTVIYRVAVGFGFFVVFIELESFRIRYAARLNNKTRFNVLIFRVGSDANVNFAVGIAAPRAYLVAAGRARFVTVKALAGSIPACRGTRNFAIFRFAHNGSAFASFFGKCVLMFGNDFF